MPPGPKDKKFGRLRSRCGGVGGRIGPARVGSKLRGRKGHRVLVLLLQGFRNLWRQLGVDRPFKPFLALVFGFEFRDWRSTCRFSARPSRPSGVIS